MLPGFLFFYFKFARNDWIFNVLSGAPEGVRIPDPEFVIGGFGIAPCERKFKLTHYPIDRCEVCELIRYCRACHRNPGAKTLRQIAAALNGRGIGTARGGRWAPQAVANVLRRIG
jgi:hypothetical protein